MSEDKTIVNELIKMKTETPEIGVIPPVDELNEYLSTFQFTKWKKKFYQYQIKKMQTGMS